MERRLAAIFALDMVGFSRLIEEDEAGTLARQKAHRHELIDPAIADHRGRIVKGTGDGLLAEFPSAVDAVQNALAIQSAMAGRNVELPEAQRLVFRVGINLGDVIVEGRIRLVAKDRQVVEQEANGLVRRRQIQEIEHPVGRREQQLGR